MRLSVLACVRVSLNSIIYLLFQMASFYPKSGSFYIFSLLLCLTLILSFQYGIIWCTSFSLKSWYIFSLSLWLSLCVFIFQSVPLSRFHTLSTYLSRYRYPTNRFPSCLTVNDCKQINWLDQCLWFSWQSGCFQNQRSAVRIQSSAKFYTEHDMFTANCWNKK